MNMDEFFDPVCPCKTRCIMCYDVLNYMLDIKFCEKTVGGNVVTLRFVFYSHVPTICWLRSFLS